MDSKVAPATPQMDNDNQKQQTMPDQQQQQQQKKQQQQQQQWQQLLQPALQSASHSSLSSVESVEFIQIDGSPMMKKRRSQLETLGRIIFLLSVIFLIVGIITTVFGFANINLTRAQQLPMQIVGPACLVVTVAMWLIGLTFCRLWNAEIRRQKQAMELRTRVQLHALAMDLLKKPVVLSPRALQDPRLRRQLLMKLRQQNALDASSIDTTSRRSSRAPSLDMRRRQKSNSIISSFLKNGASADHRKSTDTCTSSAGGRVVFPPPQFDLPGIHISRIETIDYDDSSVFSGSGQIGTTRFIVIHSDGSSDFSRLSFPNSECSLSAGSRSSRSRSSKDSSNVSSRLWDFSPRESDWDVNVPLSGGGGGGGGGGSHRNDLPGGARDYSMLSPSMPRKGSVVTFDISEPTVRRHSSPASSVRRKDSINMVAGECPCCRSDYPPVQGAKDERSAAAAAVYRKKSSGDQSLMSITIDENDGDEDDDDDECDAETCPLNPYDASTTAPAAVAASDQPSIPERSGFHPAAAAAAPGGRQQQQQSAAPHPPPPPRSCGRPSLRRHNTDDSEIERRMAKVFHEINYSLTDSLEETKYQSPEGVAEAETQTMSEQEIEALLKDFGGGGKRSDEKLAQSDRADGAAARSDPAAEFINSSETSGHSRGEREGDPGRPTAEKRSKLSLLTAALFPGRNRKSSTKGEEGKRPPNRRRGVLLMLGLTE